MIKALPAEKREAAIGLLRKLVPIPKTEKAKALETQGWRAWVAGVLPDTFDTEFIDDHVDFWEWGWKFLIALRDGKPLTEEENAFLAIWSRNFGKSTQAEAFIVAAVCVVGYGIFLYVSGTQDLANTHLSNVELLLTSSSVKEYYPEHSRPKKSAVTSSNKSWNQSRLETDGGVVLQAVGLNVGVRGLRKGKDRVRGFVLDDIDDYGDSPTVALNKANTLGNSVLPTADLEFFVIGAQNLITEHSVFNRIYTKADKMLAHRVVSGPHPAFDELETKVIDGRDIITHCVPRWPERVTKQVGQRYIDTFGLIRFMAEFQHDLGGDKEGLVLKNWRDSIHVITQSQFEAVYGSREIPLKWNTYGFHDWAETKTERHANVAGFVSISSQGSRLPGRLFLHDVLSFPAGADADDVAIGILKAISPAYDWD
jgi:hypothetical protein